MKAVDPWGNPFPVGGTPSITVAWDYVNEVVVDADHFSLFCTTWKYIYAPGDPFGVTDWRLSRAPGDEMWVHDNEVPEMVRLAVMVIE